MLTFSSVWSQSTPPSPRLSLQLHQRDVSQPCSRPPPCLFSLFGWAAAPELEGGGRRPDCRHHLAGAAGGERPGRLIPRPRAGWVSELLLESLRSAAQPPGSRARTWSSTTSARRPRVICGSPSLMPATSSSRPYGERQRCSHSIGASTARPAACLYETTRVVCQRQRRQQDLISNSGGVSAVCLSTVNPNGPKGHPDQKALHPDQSTLRPDQKAPHTSHGGLYGCVQLPEFC